MTTRFFLFSMLLICGLSACSDEPIDGEITQTPEEEPTPEDDPTTGDDPTTDFTGQLERVVTYGGSNEDEANNVVATSDGGVIVIGSTRSIDGDITDKTAPNFDVWVLKLNAAGDIQWSKTYGGSNADLGEAIINTTDGGYAFIGSSRSNDGDASANAGAADHWLVKLNASGDIQWERSYGFEGNDEGFSLIQTSDGGYFFGGVLDFTNSGGQGNDGLTRSAAHAGGEFWGTKVSSDGSLEFRRYFGGSKDDFCRGVVETPDGGFLMGGSSESIDFNIDNNKGQYDFWVMKMGTDKELEWQRSYGGSQIDFGWGFIATRDGNYILSGDVRSNDQDVSSIRGVADFWSVKISPNGNIIWENTYGGSSFDASRAVIEMSNGSIAHAGSSRSNDLQVGINRGGNDGWIAISDASGNFQSSFNIGGSDIDFLYGITQTTSNALFAVGSSFSADFDIPENKGSSDVLVIKIK